MASEEDKTEVSATVTVTLTEDQKEFLASCEEAFESRYSSADMDFMNVKDNPPSSPPIVDPWYSRPRRNFDWSDRRGQRGGNNDRDRGNHYRGYQQRNQNEGGYDQHRQGDRYYQRYRPY